MTLGTGPWCMRGALSTLLLEKGIMAVYLLTLKRTRTRRAKQRPTSASANDSDMSVVLEKYLDENTSRIHGQAN